MSWLDKFGENLSRGVVHRASRRGVLTRLGKLLVGSAYILPVLPVTRGMGNAHAQSHNGLDPSQATEDEITSCDYWRYCALDGFLCSCCGGSVTSCPPGTSPSPMTWVGTCHNPHDGKNYLVSYNDCCGKPACGRCYCNTQERERPGYQFYLHNDINWCLANDNSTFHCTTSVLVGLANE